MKLALLAITLLGPTALPVSSPVRPGARATSVPGRAMLAQAEAPAGSPRVAISGSLVVKVTDRNQAADTLIGKAEALGGYFSTRRDDLVVLRVPNATYADLIKACEPLGQVLQRTHNARDVTFDIEEKRTLLASRESMLARYFEVLNDAGPQAVVTVERQMTQLIQDIETLRGALQLSEHNVALAELSVSFQFRERRPPERDGRSSFVWLNTMNLTDLIGDFRHEN